MCCGFIFDEIVCLAKLAFPTMIFNTLDILLLVSDMMMLGAVGKEALAVGALGNAFYNMLWYFNEGVLTAQDNLSAQSFGLRDYEAIRQWMYVSMLVMFPLSIIGTVIMFFSPLIVEDIFRLHGDMIAQTSLYIILLIPALWFQAAFRIGQKYLLAQHVLKPSVYCIMAGVGINIFFNFMFMVAIDGSSAGCAVSTSITRACMVVLLALYMRFSSEHSETFYALKDGWFHFFHKHKTELLILKDKINNNESIAMRAHGGDAMSESSINSEDSQGVEMTDSTHHSDADDNDDTTEEHEDTDTLLSTPHTDRDRDRDRDRHGPRGQRGSSQQTTASRHSGTRFPSLFQTKQNTLLFLSLGIPGGLVLIVELWTFDIATIIVSQIGNVSVASQSILILYTTVSFVMIPLALSIASSVRVSQLLASQNSEAAKVSAITALFLASLLCGSSSYLFYSLRDLLGYLFTSDVDIIQRCSQLADIFALLQFVNGVQGTAQGVMRGMSRQKELFGMTFFSYWLFGLPLGVYLTFFTRPRFGLYGLWSGFTVGLGMLALVLVGTILFTDWNREMRRTQLRIEKYSQSVTPLAWLGEHEQGSVGVNHMRGRLSYLTQASAIPGSRALGGFAMLDSRTEADELDDYERIEISLNVSEKEERDGERGGGEEGMDQSNSSERSADDQL